MPRCPICAKLIYGNFDMHEAIITRGMVQMSSLEKKEKIHVKENVVLLHPECHKDARSSTNKEKCILDIVNYEGEEAVLNWLESIRDDFPTIVDNSIREVQNIIEEF